LRAVASGLMIEKVRSIGIIVLVVSLLAGERRRLIPGRRYNGKPTPPVRTLALPALRTAKERSAQCRSTQ